MKRLKIFLVILFHLFPVCLTGGEINNLKPIYSVKESDIIPYIDPKLFQFPFKKYGIANFPVPANNAVGTINLNNAIIFVYFE